MIDLAVTVKWSKGAQAAGSTIQADLKQPMAIASAMADHLRRRCIGGEFATEPKPFSTKAKLTRKGKPRALGYYVSPAYAVEAHTKTAYPDSAAFHAAAGAIAGAGNVTGKMWAGLQVRNFGDQSAIVEFGGSSLGAKSIRSANTRAVRDQSGALVHEWVKDRQGRLIKRQKRELVKDDEGKQKYRRKPALVRNNLKAYAVFRHSHIGLLQPTDGEIYTVLQAFRAEADIVVKGALGQHLDSTPPPPPPGVSNNLYYAMLNNFRK